MRTPIFLRGWRLRTTDSNIFWRMKVMKRLFMVMMAMAVALAFSGVSYAGDGAALWGSKKCKNCHKMDAKKKVGPGLADITKRRTDDWIVKWLVDPQGVWEANDAETQEMKKEVKGESRAKTKMKMPKVSEAEAKALLDYMKANGG